MKIFWRHQIIALPTDFSSLNFTSYVPCIYTSVCKPSFIVWLFVRMYAFMLSTFFLLFTIKARTKYIVLYEYTADSNIDRSYYILAIAKLVRSISHHFLIAESGNEMLLSSVYIRILYSSIPSIMCFNKFHSLNLGSI